jgi:hypothetical protein
MGKAETLTFIINANSTLKEDIPWTDTSNRAC